VGVADHVVESLNGTRILGELGPDLHPVTILAIDALTTNLELHNLDEAVADVVEPAEAVEVGGTGDEVDGGEHNLNVGAVHQVRIAVDDGSDALVKVRLSIEGDLDGLHGEVGVALVEDLPEGDLGVPGDVDILRTIRHELKKTASHFVMLHGKKIFFSARTTEKNGNFSETGCLIKFDNMVRPIRSDDGTLRVFHLRGISSNTVRMETNTIDELIAAHTPLQNPDGTENQVAVEAVNDLGAELARLFAAPAVGARRRRRTYRRRRRDVLRTR